ncbi:uncharacterized protein N7525_009970 [Penicillium rubens]|uniref:uncharacterized protein n=1 Tax=Penicillium rubens TaxID=1108849 RepID=UPI002A5A4BD3|nr:uncharacterized protein N7525_009970 [Penicillium rubens]KAJ5820686.1 hypothetical protein N7525_009970 [Penicillium rubens]KAJ5848803.1 hypothetical protein N7534_008121 [Penicillium rubens]
MSGVHSNGMGRKTVRTSESRGNGCPKEEVADPARQAPLNLRGCWSHLGETGPDKPLGTVLHMGEETA